MGILSAITKVTNFLPLMVIKFYKTFISPMFPPVCRFEPTCSSYGLMCFQHHPFFKALWLTCWRILRCNPFNPGGYDPIPAPKGVDPASWQEEFGCKPDETLPPSEDV